MFFLDTIFVPPNRFRPESKMGDERYLHDQTNILGKVLQLNQDLRTLISIERLN